MNKTNDCGAELETLVPSNLRTAENWIVPALCFLQIQISLASPCHLYITQFLCCVVSCAQT